MQTFITLRTLTRLPVRVSLLGISSIISKPMVLLVGPSPRSVWTKQGSPQIMDQKKCVDETSRSCPGRGDSPLRSSTFDYRPLSSILYSSWAQTVVLGFISRHQRPIFRHHHRNSWPTTRLRDSELLFLNPAEGLALPCWRRTCSAVLSLSASIPSVIFCPKTYMIFELWIYFWKSSLTGPNPHTILQLKSMKIVHVWMR